MTVSPSPALDNGSAPYPVARGVRVAQAAVRAAGEEDRYEMWSAFTAALEEAKQDSQRAGQVMPWESQEEISVITVRGITRALEAMISVVDGIGERRRLVMVAAREDERAEAEGQGKMLRPSRFGIKRCARCSKPFRAVSHKHAYCSGACRTAASEARKAADGDGRADVSTEAGAALAAQVTRVSEREANGGHGQGL